VRQHKEFRGTATAAARRGAGQVRAIRIQCRSESVLHRDCVDHKQASHAITHSHERSTRVVMMQREGEWCNRLCEGGTSVDQHALTNSRDERLSRGFAIRECVKAGHAGHRGFPLTHTEDDHLRRPGETRMWGDEVERTHL
jgi:hypothetical protein